MCIQPPAQVPTDNEWWLLDYKDQPQLPNSYLSSADVTEWTLTLENEPSHSLVTGGDIINNSPAGGDRGHLMGFYCSLQQPGSIQATQALTCIYVTGHFQKQENE